MIEFYWDSFLYELLFGEFTGNIEKKSINYIVLCNHVWQSQSWFLQNQHQWMSTGYKKAFKF